MAASHNLEDRNAIEAMLLAQIAGQDVPGTKQEGAIPLTPGQESLWFLDQVNPDVPAYNVPQAFRIRGRLDIPALQRAFAAVAARHEALRTRISETRNGLIQKIDPEPRVDFTFETAAEGFENRLEIFARKKFDLENDAPLRVLVIEVTPEDHVLAVCLPHILSDMTSLQLMHDDLATAYRQAQGGAEVAFATEPVQFQEFARQQSKAQGSERDLTFWRERLAGASPGLHLATDLPDRRRTGRGELYFFHIDPVTTENLNAIARAHGSSLYMVLLAAWQALLFRYSGSRDTLIGVPFSQREFPGADQMLGYLINLLIYRSRIGPDTQFSDLIRETRDQALEIYDHPALPFSRIVQELQLPRDGGRNSLAPVVFQYLPAGIASLSLGGLKVEPLAVPTHTSKFDLTLTIAQDGAALLGEFEYSTDLYTRPTVERMAKHFNRLLAFVTADPSTKIGRFDLLLPEEQIQVARWNRTQTAYPRNSSVPELFEQTAGQHSNKVALKFAETKVTYGELNQRANKLARLLANRGVAQGARVGLALERSTDLIAAMIAVVKCGAAFVPIDPKYPRERIEMMLRESGAELLVVRRNDPQRDFERTRTLALEDQEIVLRSLESSNPSLPVFPEDACYVMYTSGSTGKPKAVAVPHRAVVRLVKDTNFARFSSEEVFLQFAPVTFDASTLEIWGALLNGGTLVIYPPAFESFQQLRGILRSEGVTTLWLTAGLFNSIVDQDPETLSTVKQLLIGGDTLSVPHVRKALAALPGTAIINGYGPTENTTFTCCYRIPRDWPEDRSIPIGRPVSNTQVFLLDDCQNLVPIGVFGELYAGGDGLAAGYINDAELTRQKFVSSSLAGGARLYRTGDFARYLPDGTIEFKGRMDHQFKIRGFRVELGEVEEALRSIPAVRDAVVQPYEESAGTKALAAYLAGKDGGRLDIESVREHLNRILPEHLVPSRFIQLDSFPLNSNGKVDRGALPKPGTAPEPEGTALPESPDEEKLLRLWQDILCLEDIGVTDNFFVLGGHSLLATRIISRTNQAFGARLTVSDIFEAPTVRGLARRLSREKRSEEKAIGRVQAAQSPESLLSKLDSLDDADVDALLKKYLQ